MYLALKNSNEEREQPESPQMNIVNDDLTNIILNADVVFSNTYETESDKLSTSYNVSIIDLEDNLINENKEESDLEHYMNISDELINPHSTNVIINSDHELNESTSYMIENSTNQDANNMMVSNECEANISTISSEELNLSDCEENVCKKKKRGTKKELLKWKREVSKK